VTGTALACTDPDACPSCTEAVGELTMTEAPLLRHGGYGAARATTLRWCRDPDCGWWLVTDVSEVDPR